MMPAKENSPIMAKITKPRVYPLTKMYAIVISEQNQLKLKNIINNTAITSETKYEKNNPKLDLSPHKNETKLLSGIFSNSRLPLYFDAVKIPATSPRTKKQQTIIIVIRYCLKKFEILFLNL